MTRFGTWTRPACCWCRSMSVWEAMAMVTDLRGEIVTAPFKFAMTATGVKSLAQRTTTAVANRLRCCAGSGSSRPGTTTPTVTRLVEDAVEVVELNPAAVKHARAQRSVPARRPTSVTWLRRDLLSRSAGRTPGATPP